MTSSYGNIFRVTGPQCGEPSVGGRFFSQMPVTRRYGVFFDLLSRSWWYHCSDCAFTENFIRKRYCRLYFCTNNLFVPITFPSHQWDMYFPRRNVPSRALPWFVTGGFYMNQSCLFHCVIVPVAAKQLYTTWLTRSYQSHRNTLYEKTNQNTRNPNMGYFLSTPCTNITRASWRLNVLAARRFVRQHHELLEKDNCVHYTFKVYSSLYKKINQHQAQRKYMFMQVSLQINGSELRYIRRWSAC